MSFLKQMEVTATTQEVVGERSGEGGCEGANRHLTHFPEGPRSAIMYIVCRGVLRTWLLLTNSSEGSQVMMRDLRRPPSLGDAIPSHVPVPPALEMLGGNGGVTQVEAQFWSQVPGGGQPNIAGLEGPGTP